MPKHVAVWIDHHEARIFHLDPEQIEETTVKAAHHLHHKHPKGEGTHEHPEDTKRFFHEVASKLEGTEEILVVGPSSAKLEFIRYVHKHDHAVEPRIVGVETVDHPTDGQLVAHAKAYFKRTDRMR